MSKPRERKVESDCNLIAAAAGYEHCKMKVRNWPDDGYFGPGGDHFFVEYKRRGEAPRPGQKLQIEKLRAKGHDVFVVDCTDQFRAIISDRESHVSLPGPFSEPVVV